MPFELTGRTKTIHCKGELEGLILTVDMMVPFNRIAKTLEENSRENMIEALCIVIKEWDFECHGKPVPLGPEAFDEYLPYLAPYALNTAINEALFEGYDPLVASSPTQDARSE